MMPTINALHNNFSSLSPCIDTGSLEMQLHVYVPLIYLISILDYKLPSSQLQKPAHVLLHSLMHFGLRHALQPQ